MACGLSELIKAKKHGKIKPEGVVLALNLKCMNMKLGQLEDTLEDESQRRNLRASFSKLRSLTGKDGRDFEIGSKEKMGRAAGIHYNADDRVEVRPDVVESALQGANNNEHFLKVGVHEIIHDDQKNEGWTEWLASLLTQTRPVESLRQNVRHMEAIEAVVGRQVLKENALEEGGELVVLQDYVQKRVAQGMGWIEAANECNEHLRMAEEYAA